MVPINWLSNGPKLFNFERPYSPNILSSDASETKTVLGQYTAYAMQLYHDSLKATEKLDDILFPVLYHMESDSSCHGRPDLRHAGEGREQRVHARHATQDVKELTLPYCELSRPPRAR